MVEKFFLALDYKTDDEAIRFGEQSLQFLDAEFQDALRGKLGVKVNLDAITGPVDPRYRQFAENDYVIFNDLKIAHGVGTGKRTIDRALEHLPFKYFTVFAGLGQTMLRGYNEHARNHGMLPITFTVHTNIPPEEALTMYKGETIEDAIYNLGAQAAAADFDSIVLEADALRNDKIRNLPLKKLVTGIRINPQDAGVQSRVTALGDLAELKEHVNYVVVSSKYLGKPKELASYFATLL